MSNKTINTIAVAALIIAIGGLTMGYAAFTQTLNINTDATVQSNDSTWKIYFSNQDTGVATGNAVKGNITLNTTDVSVSGVILKTAGDKVEYTFDVKNEGQVDATLATLTPKTPSLSGDSNDQEKVESGYTYKLTYVDGGNVQQGDELNSGDTKKMKLTISLNEGISLPAGDVTISNLGYTLVYSQK